MFLKLLLFSWIIVQSNCQITFLVAPSDITVAVGSPALFNCSVSSTASASISWQKDGITISPAPTKFTFLPNNSLLINPTETGDDGTYSCVVTDTASSQSFSRNASLVFAFILDSFLVEPDSQTVSEGNLVHFFCIHGGSVPPASISWTLNGTAVSPSSRVNIVTSVLLQTNPPQVTSTLTIASAQRTTDMGTIRCLATNPLLQTSPVTSTAAILSIRALPAPATITSNPVGIVVADGATASLSCTAAGEPSPSISWLLNGSPVTLSGGVAVENRDSTSVLSIASTTVATTGNYSCVANNSEGSATSSTAQLQIATIGTSFVLEPMDSTALIGQTIVLDCRPPFSIPPAVISWSRNSVQINSSRHQVLQSGSLSISMVELGDAGIYACIATNNFLSTSITSSGGSLSVLGVPSVSPPVISASVGQTATFSCNTVGVPTPEIAWLKGTNQIVSGVNPRVTISGSSLTISDIVVQDGAYYTCSTSLFSLATMSQALLTVQAPPSFTSLITNVTAILSNSVSLPCSTIPDPGLNFSWYFDNVLLSPETSGGNLAISSTGTLTISSVVRSNEGTYTCMAVNNLGAANGTVNLEIYVPSSIMAVSSTVMVVQDSTAVLQCMSQGIPVPVQTWTRNGALLSGSRFLVSGDGRTLTISNSSEADEGMYICHAINVVGNASSEVVLEVQVPATVMVTPSSLTLNAGATATFICSATGDPSPQISWLTGEGIDVSSLTDPRYSVQSVSGGGTSLVISNLQGSDDQQFTCQGINSISMATSAVSLTVLVPSSVSLQPQTTGIQGRELTIVCGPSGQPQPTVTWLRGGTSIQTDSRVTVNAQGSLVFSPVFSTDASTYTCIATNVLGNASATTALTVQVAPVIQVATPNVTANTGSSAVLDCVSSGSPIPTVTWSFNSAPVLPAGLPRIQLASNNSLLISQVQARDEGMYLCQATNIAGTESATIELIVHVAPTIQAETSIVTAIAGNSATMRCTASGDPVPSQTWTRNGVAISNSRFLIQSGGSELLIQNVMETDQGQYECLASNSAGSDNAIVNLNVISVPVVQLPLTSVAATEGSNIALDCQASGDPNPTVAWFFNSVQVPNSETQHITQAINSSLIFSPVQSSDRGRYVCQATNAAGQDSASLQLTVYVTPTVRAEQNSLTAVRGTATTMTCSATGDPVPDLTWTRSGTALTGPRFQISSDGRSLTVTNVQVVDEGVYVCSATNPAATRTDTVFLNVIVPPEFAVLSNSTAVENQQHTMTCLATGDPTPLITWRYNGQVVASQQGVVTFTPVLRNNAGIYTCTASNTAGTISSNIFLDVQYIPAITEAPQNMSVAAGVRAELICQADGNPTPQISWLFNNSLIPGAQSSSYTIAMVTASNAGQYTCLSSNGIGIASATATLTVLFPPSSPTLLVANATASSVIALQWSASSSDGGSPVTSHVVQYRDISDLSTFQNRTFPASSLTVELDGLNPFVTYEVRVRANNIAGLSVPSNSLTARTHPAAPSSPSGFTVSSSSATSVSLRWGMPETLNGMFAAYEIRYGRDDSFTTSVQETLLFTSMFTIVGLEVGVTYRMEVRASTISLIGETLWGPFAVLLVRDGVEQELPTTIPTASPTTMATTEPPPTSTELPSTEPPSTQPPDTESPSTEPPSTEPQSTGTSEPPPSTQPPPTDPPSTDPLTSEPRSTPTPSTEPPPTDPLTTESTSAPPSTLPPETNPPPTGPLNPPVVVPSGLTALIPPGTVDQILLYWREPTMPGSFIGYHVIVTPPPPPHIPIPIRVPYSPISSTYVLEGLTGMTTYNITVATYNNDGLGPQTEFTIITTPESAPTAPRSLQVIRVGTSNLLFVSWLAPDPSNGILTQYRVRVLVNGTDQEVASRTIDITPTSHETEAIIDNLDPNNVLYHILVSASTSAGEGPAAEFFIGVDTSTPGTPPSSPPTGLLTTTPSPVSTSNFTIETSPVSNATTMSMVEQNGRDGTYYTVRIVPPIVGALIIVALVMAILWCCLYCRRVHKRKTKQYKVADYQINLKDIPEVEEQVDYGAEYDKHFVKEAFDSNVSFNPHGGQESSGDSGSEPDEHNSDDQEVLIPFSTAVGRDAVQETEENEDEFHVQDSHKQHNNGKHKERPAPQPSQNGVQQPFNYAPEQGYYPQGPFINGGGQNNHFHPAYGISSGGIMETRIGAVGSTRSDTASGADIY